MGGPCEHQTATVGVYHLNLYPFCLGTKGLKLCRAGAHNCMKDSGHGGSKTTTIQISIAQTAKSQRCNADSTHQVPSMRH